ncbi:hypothetical protein [Taibaiella koreensis]|uniref:hypothetical protein n=1 Tax=Taibaiella koreensis TaxID=1268548 RepID=UPI000E59ED9C|nr:hypothetical protein [Taibaiella koreensis]
MNLFLIRIAITAIVMANAFLATARPNEEDSRIRTGDTTRFRGHTFLWAPEDRDSQTVEDPVTSEIVWLISKRAPEIDKMDGDEVYSNNYEALEPARFGKDADAFYAYVIAQFRQRFAQLPDSLYSLYIDNLVIDEQGKIRYYDISCMIDHKDYDINQAGPAYKPYGAALSHIIDTSPAWYPATLRRRLVKVHLRGFYVFSKSS